MDPDTRNPPAHVVHLTTQRYQLLLSTLTAAACGTLVASQTVILQALAVLLFCFALAAQWFAIGRLERALILIEKQLQALTQGQLVSRLAAERCGPLGIL